MAMDWSHIRPRKFSLDRPDEWPPAVQGISVEGLPCSVSTKGPESFIGTVMKLSLRASLALRWLAMRSAP
jgi:hypothetical protein